MACLNDFVSWQGDKTSRLRTRKGAADPANRETNQEEAFPTGSGDRAYLVSAVGIMFRPLRP